MSPRAIAIGALLGALAVAPAAATEFAVASGGSVEIGHAYAVDANCASLGMAQISVLQPPGGGRIEVVKGRTYPNFSTLNTHSRCNSRKVPAVTIIYRSTPGYHGGDEVTYEIVFPSGRLIRRTVTLSVR